MVFPTSRQTGAWESGFSNTWARQLLFHAKSTWLEINRERGFREGLQRQAEKDTIFIFALAIVTKHSTQIRCPTRKVFVHTVLLILQCVVVALESMRCAESPFITHTGVGVKRVEIGIAEERMILDVVVAEAEVKPVGRHELQRRINCGEVEGIVEKR